LNNHKLLVYLD